LEFAEFSKKYEFVNQISSPNYATEGVKIAKRLPKKVIANRKDPYMALLNYRAAHWKMKNHQYKCCMVEET